MPPVWLKSNKILRETNKREYCMCACQARTDGQTVREKTDKHRQSRRVRFFYAFVPYLPISSVLACFFFLIRRLALRGDATPPDYSVYSCCDALFIIFSAALLDWHSSLEHFTTALYSWSSHYPLNTRYAKSSDG